VIGNTFSSGIKFIHLAMKIFLYYISSFVLGCCLISCAAPSVAPDSSGLLQAERRYAHLKRTFGEVAGLEGYFDYLLARLATDPGLNRSVEVSLLDSGESFAFAMPSGRIALSRGLVTSLASEGELAFILAHEIGHIALNHFDLSAKKNVWQSEHAADIFAVKLLSRGGYDPRVAQLALLHSYSHTFSPTGTSGTHPDIRARQLIIQQEIQKLGRPPLASIESHQFRQIQRRLRQGP